MKRTVFNTVLLSILLLLCTRLTARQKQEFSLSESIFQKPAANRYKPLTWWHWINGNVTKDGIRKDLVDMKEKGIGGVQLFDTHMYLPPGPVRYGTKEWYDHVRFAIRLCDSLGLEFYMMNSPGWSGAGGPWVTLEQSMKKMVFSETTVAPGDKATIIPQPESYKGFYKDITLLAIRSGIKSNKSEELLKRNGMAKMPFLPKEIPGNDTAGCLQANDIIDVSNYFDTATNNLRWQSPEGNWVILRFGYSSTGKVIHPAVPEGTGYEVDKLDTAAVAFQFEQTAGRMIREAGAYTGKTFKGILFDSYEGGFQNWTAAMPALFRQLKGYDLTGYLPVLAGRKVGSERLSYAFLWDFHDALIGLFARNYYGTMQELAHRHQLEIFIEGQGGPMSPAFVNAYADVPMNEFWTGGNITGRANQIKQSVSIANVLGKTLVGAESFTSTPENGKWQNTPYRVKRTGDYAFVYGINKFIFHTYTHQPFELEPGFTMGRYGMHFGRTNTWWQYAGAWISYLSRCQYLLQQGRSVADVCLLFPRDAVYEFIPNTPKVPEGYNYDICYPDYLARAKWVNNRLELPSGASYRLLVLPEYGYMTYSTLQDIYRLLTAGCIVSGPCPKAMPDRYGIMVNQKEFDELVQKIWGGLDGKVNTTASVGNGKIYYNKPVAEILDQYHITEDLRFTGAGSADSLKYIHRNTGDADIYFISNQADSTTSFHGIFRIAGKLPELWDPVSGKIKPVDHFEVNENTIRLPLSLAPSGSLFVVFRKNMSAGKSKLPATVKKVKPIAVPVKENWTVEFLDGRGAPAKILMPELSSWSLNSDSNIRYYSGRAAYNNSFMLTEKQIRQYKTFQLDLGDIADIGEVIINGKSAGTVWTKPYAADISALVKSGRNELKIIIANRWINRLIGDENIPVNYEYQSDGSKFTIGRMLKWPDWMYDPSKPKNAQRNSFTTWKHYSAGDTLVASGLLGPVRLFMY